MTTKIRAVFDGEVFRPKDEVDLTPNVEYTITIEESESATEEYPLTAIGRLAKDMGVTDLASNHDWYAHGRIPDPKHGE